MKASRTIVGIILLLGGTYVVVGEHFAGTSSFATVNARIYTVRSPIDGQVSLALKGIGSRVNAGELIAEIVDDRFDSSRLLDLERGQDLLAIEARRIETQRTALVAAKEVFERQVADYQRGRIAQINARIAESQAIEDSAQARLREADSGLRRARDLSERGVQTAANLERASAARDVAQQDVESARQRRNYLLTELASARSGVFIGDSYNDAPFSLQRVRELELRIAEIVAEREQAEARIAQNERQIRAEVTQTDLAKRARVSRQTVNNLMCDRSVPTALTAMKLEIILQCDAQRLLQMAVETELGKIDRRKLQKLKPILTKPKLGSGKATKASTAMPKEVSTGKARDVRADPSAKKRSSKPSW